MISQQYEKYLQCLENAFQQGYAMKPVLLRDLGELIEAAAVGHTADVEPGPVNDVVPDLTILKNKIAIGHIVACKPGQSMGIAVSKGDILRYIRSINNLLFTNFLEFRWYASGKIKGTAIVAFMDNRKQLYAEDQGIKKTDDLFKDFLGLQR